MGNKNNDPKKFDGLKKQIMSNIGKEISDDQVKKNTDNIPVKNPFIRKNAMAISALISLIGCFLPFQKSSADFSRSGQSVTGKTGIFNQLSIEGSDSTLNFLALIIIAIPIVIIIMNFIPALKKHRRKIALIAPVVGLLCEMALYSKLDKLRSGAAAFAGKMGANLSMKLGIGAIAIAAGFILTIIVGLFVYYGVKKDDLKK